MTTSVAWRSCSLTRLKRACSSLLAHETLDLPDAGEVIVQERIHGRRGAPLQPITAMRGERVPERAARRGTAAGASATRVSLTLK